MQIINIFSYYGEIVTIRVVQYAHYEACARGSILGHYSTEQEAIKAAKDFVEERYSYEYEEDNDE